MLSHLLLLLPLLLARATADTPANCTFQVRGPKDGIFPPDTTPYLVQDVAGSWMFYESERSQGSSLDCTGSQPVVQKQLVELKFPNVAVDGWGVEGTWTMVYNQVGGDREEVESRLLLRDSR